MLPQLLAALAGTLGTVGFVAVVGGAITWNRFNAVELPADQAVAAFPEAELVAIGAASLLVFLLIGAGAVVMISQIERRGPCERRWGLLTLVALGMLYAIGLVPEESLGGEVGVSDVERAVGYGLICLAWLLAFGLLGWRKEEQAPKLKWLFFGHVPTTGTAPRPGPEGRLRLLKTGGWRLVEAVRKTLRRIARLRPSRETGGWFRVLLTTNCKVAAQRLMMILFGAEVLFATAMWRFYDAWLGGTLLIGGLLGAICLLIGDRDHGKRFAGYGLAIFAAVIVFGAATEAMKARYRPEVQPAALLRAGDEDGRGVCGLYITENDERVYFARLRPDSDEPSLPAANSGRIFFVDKENVEALSIGPLMGIGHATTRAQELRAELVTDSLPPKPTEETIVTTRTFERRGVEIEEQRTRLRSAQVRRSAATGQGVAAAPGDTAQEPQDKHLAARLAEARLSCTPTAAASG